MAGATLVSVTLSAQRFDIGVNLKMGMPMGGYYFEDEDFTIPPSFGIGGSVEANYWFNDAVSAGLEVGFISFADKENYFEEEILNSKMTTIPIIAKAEYHLSEDAIRPFVGIGVGYGIVSRQFTGSLILDKDYKVIWNQNGIIISPRVGFLSQATDALAVNLSIQYNLMMNSFVDNVELTTEFMGQVETNIASISLGATHYLGINLGVSYTLFD